MIAIHTSHGKSHEISAHISKVSFAQESRSAQRQAGLLKQAGRLKQTCDAIFSFRVEQAEV
jgi:hypothetical protein